LSPLFIEEWGHAFDAENAGFQKMDCFKPTPLPPGRKVLPGIWRFTRKHDHSAKPVFVSEDIVKFLEETTSKTRIIVKCCQAETIECY